MHTMNKKVIQKQNNAKDCLVCGIQNNAGLHAEFFELEDGTLIATATAKSEHQSYPNRVHGGIVSALLDETIGRAVNIAEPDAWGVTVELSVRFKKPVPYDVPLRVTGRITQNSRLLFAGEGELLLPDGSVAAAASGRFMKMKLSNIADFDAQGEDWAQHLRPEDPVEFDLPELGTD